MERMSLSELVNQLSKSFDECLENILTDPQQKEETNKVNKWTIGLETSMSSLKASFLEIESKLMSIRLEALEDKQLSLEESNKLLKRDIDIKKDTIKKYVTKLDEWSEALPILITNSKDALKVRTDGYDFDSDITLPNEQDVTTLNSESNMAYDTVQSTEGTVYTQPTVETMNSDDDEDDDDIEFEEV
ncbi:hypothetical protein BDB01DRAFT_528237 [Pilobolus umbonatus]|nr:hypothetical protein BDB01DRAFT_528237 [Pilobolus umbonatus]